MALRLLRKLDTAFSLSFMSNSTESGRAAYPGGMGVYILVSMTCETATWGVYIPLFICTLHSLVTQGIRGSRPRQALLVVTLVMFGCSTASTWLDLKEKCIVIHDLLEGTYHLEDLSEDWYYKDSLDLFKRPVVWGILQGINLVLSDIIVMWRCWAIWKDHRLAKLLFYVGLAILLILTVVGAFITSPPFLSSVLDDRLTHMALVSPFPLVNITTTALIGVKAWKHRDHTPTPSLNSTDDSGRRRVKRILLLLVESGLVYCLLWIAWYICAAFPREIPLGIKYLESMMGNLSGIYPTLVIVLVLLDKSIESKIPVSETRNISSMHFASMSAVRSSDTTLGIDMVPSALPMVLEAESGLANRNITSDGTTTR